MTTKVLLNTVRMPGGVLAPAGTLVDTTLDPATTATITSAGGVLVDTGDSLIDAAATLARSFAVRGQGGSVDVLLALALAQSGKASAVAALANAATAQAAAAAAQATADAAGGGGGGTFTLIVRESLVTPSPDGATVATLFDNEATATTFSGAFIGGRNIVAVFSTSFPGNVTLSGLARDGTTVTETLTNPGAGGGTVTGTKLFWRLLGPGIGNTVVSGSGTHSVQLQYGQRLGVANAPVASFVVVTDPFLPGVLTVATSSLSEGWVNCGAVTGDSLEVLYTVAVTPV